LKEGRYYYSILLYWKPFIIRWYSPCGDVAIILLTTGILTIFIDKTCSGGWRALIFFDSRLTTYDVPALTGSQLLSGWPYIPVTDDIYRWRLHRYSIFLIHSCWHSFLQLRATYLLQSICSCYFGPLFVFGDMISFLRWGHSIWWPYRYFSIVISENTFWLLLMTDVFRTWEGIRAYLLFGIVVAIVFWPTFGYAFYLFLPVPSEIFNYVKRGLQYLVMTIKPICLLQQCV